MKCGWCGRPLSDAQARRVPAPMRYLAAVGVAFLHGGMWAMQWLAEPFCARCRATLVPLIAFGAAIELSIIAWLARLWLKR